MSSSGSAYGQWNCHENSGKTNFGHTKWRPSSSIYEIYEGSTYNLFTKGEGEDGHEGKGRVPEQEGMQGRAGQVLGARCDFRTSRVSHPPKSVIQTVI